MAKPTSITSEAVSLPKGGAAFKPIDEMFKSDLATGSGIYQIPLSVPKGVNNLAPSIILSYSTGQGNSHFGMGWAIHLPKIIRSTKKAVPTFSSDDLFLFDSRELIDIGGGLYQPEVESEFLEIRRTNIDSWQVRTKNGLTMILGSTENSRQQIAQGKTVQWLLDSMEDSNGNKITYEYQKDGNEAYLRTITYAIYKIEFNYEKREDVYFDFRLGYEVQTNFRCKTIDLTLLKPSVQPIKSYRMEYEQAKYSKISLLKKVALVAQNKTIQGAIEEIPLAPIIFSYSEFDPKVARLEIFKSAETSPPFLHDPNVSLIDIEGNGRPGIIEIKNGTARFWANKGELEWAPPKTIEDLPVRDDLSSANMIFVDMDGDGTADLLVGGQHGGFYPAKQGGGWDTMVRYRQSLSFPLNEAGTRLFDIDGNGRMDALHADGKAFYYYLNQGRQGWTQYPLVQKRVRDTEQWPDVDLADLHVRLADVVGDGRSHIVQIFSGRIVFWPNLGNGKWGRQKRIKNAPTLPRNYDPNRLFFADIDGDGVADVVYVDYDKITCWINQSGQSFSEPLEIKGTPPIANAAIIVADLNATGTNGVLWSYSDALRRKTAYRYLDLASGKKPYLLNRIKNNTGIVTDIEYSTSSKFKMDTDPELNGKKSFLPFPVHVVKEIIVQDGTRKIQGKTTFTYHHGNYDSLHKRFLGFAKATRTEHGDETEASTKFVSYFHNQDIYFKGLPYYTETLDGNEVQPQRPYTTEEDEYELKTLKELPNGRTIKFVCKTAVDTKTYEKTDKFNEVEKSFKYDEFGNRTEEITETKWYDYKGNVQVSVLKKETQYAKNLSKWLVGFPRREIVRDGNGTILAGKIVYYDGPDFTGLPEGQIEKGNVILERHLAFTQTLATQIFGPVDLAPLGYVKIIDPVFGEGYYVDLVSQRYDSSGNPVERRNARGKTTTVKFDEYKLYPIEVVSPHGLTTKVEYEYKYGSITAYVDFNDVRKDYLYDGVGRVVGIRRHDDPADKPYIEFQYSAQNDPKIYIITLTREQTGGDQHKRITYLNGTGEILQVRYEAEDNKIVSGGARRYNSKGRLIAETKSYFTNSLDLVDDVPATETYTEYKYDATGRSTVRKDYEGNQFQTEYQLSSKWDYDPLDQINDPANPCFDTPKTEWYNAEAILTTIVERTKSKELITQYSYDALGRRIKVENEGSAFVENTFDMLGRRIESKYRDAGTFTYLYDATGNLVERKDGKGDILYRKYDDLNRVTETRFGGPLGQLEASYQYDVGPPEDHPKGHLVKVIGSCGEIEYAYECCQNLKRKTRTFPNKAPLTMKYTLDILGRVKVVDYPDGFSVMLTYNKGGLLESISNVINNVTYDPTGKRTKIEYANGVTTEIEYDKNLRQTKTLTKTPNGSKKIQDLTYAYDQLGNILSIDDEADIQGHIKNDRTFTYDELYQLTGDSGTNNQGNYNHQYIYDDKGNIKQYPEVFGNNQLLYENNNLPYQLTGIQGNNDPIEYDKSGNLTRARGTQYIFDAKNRLTKATQPDGTMVEYIYDHNGARVITKITKNQVTQTTLNFDDVYFETDNNKKDVIFDETGPVALVTHKPGMDAGVIFHKDHLGSHTAQTNLTNGNYLGQESYYAYGYVSFNNLPKEDPFGYNGKLFEEIPELQFFGGRDYLPKYGRFLTPDPLLLEQQPEKFFKNPRSLRLYCYVLNNPMNIVDPDGLWFGIDDLIVAAVGFVVGVAAYLINAAVSGTSVHFGEMLMAGLAGAAIAWLAYNTLGIGAVIVIGAAQLLAPAITGALDQASMGNSFGERFLGFLSFVIKFAASPISTTVGLIIGGFGTGFGLWGDVEWFKGGVIAFEYDPSSAFSATTFGGTVSIWGGTTNDRLFVHELYHSRQYTYFSDTFIPLWLVGGVYGLISSAVAGNFQWSCFSSSNPNSAYGNPLEDGAHDVARGGGCT